MKRIKMIVVSVVVLAIVASAFAFNAKKIGVFCVTNGSSSEEGCYTIQHSKRTTESGVNLRYYKNWDGNLSTCLSGGPNTCGSGEVFTTD